MSVGILNFMGNLLIHVITAAKIWMSQADKGTYVTKGSRSVAKQALQEDSDHLCEDNAV